MAFCILLERLAPLWLDDVKPSIEDRLAIIAEFAANMQALGPANFLYTDGDALFAHGDRRIQASGAIAAPGLWHLAGHCREGGTFSGAGIALEAEGRDREVVLMASVPLNPGSRSAKANSSPPAAGAWSGKARPWGRSRR